MLSAVLLTAAVAALSVNAGTNKITITNSCSFTVNVQFEGTNNGLANPGPLATKQSTTATFDSGFQGVIYDGTGNGNDGMDGATRAGFQLSNNYYYVQVDPKGFDAGISITPGKAPMGAFCQPVSCPQANCPASSAFHGTNTPTFAPASGSNAPAPPLYECSGEGTPYTVTFCPSGDPTPPTPPAPAGNRLHPNGNTKKCLDVAGNVQKDGTAVQIYDCNGSGAQNWVLSKGSTAVQLAGTNFCLDAGTNPHNNAGMKIWQCYPGLTQQTWYYTGDNRIAVQGQGQCLDLTNGNLADGNRVQTYSCTNGNTNQIWTE